MPNILKVPYKDRLEFWKFHHAETCMSQVLQICDDLSQVKHGSMLYMSAILSIYIIYGRPFKQWGETRLPINIVPERLKKSHEIAIEIRDKMTAHIDTGDNAAKTFDGHNLIKMIATVHNGTVSLSTMQTIVPADTGIENIRELAIAIRQKAQYHLKKLFKKYDKNLTTYPNGTWEINIGSPKTKEPLLIRAT